MIVVQISKWFATSPFTEVSLPGFGEQTKLPIYVVIVFIWLAVCLFAWEFLTEYAETRSLNSAFALNQPATALESKLIDRLEVGSLQDAVQATQSKVLELSQRIDDYSETVRARYEFLLRDELLDSIRKLAAHGEISDDTGDETKVVSAREYIERHIGAITADLHEISHSLTEWNIPDFRDAVDAYSHDIRLIIKEFHKLSDSIVSQQKIGFTYRDRFIAIGFFVVATLIAGYNLYEWITAK
jgi:hypothetical protein